MKFSPGISVPRSEDTRLLTGKGLYADDKTFPNQCHAAMVRSPHAHASIGTIDATAALAMPGVLAVLTAADWEADQLGALFNPGFYLREPLRMPDGREYVNPERKPLAADKVIFVGEAVAMVVAETAALAADAAELVEVDWEPLPAVADTAAAADPSAPLVREDVPNNVLFIHEFGDAAATESAFLRASRVIRQRLVCNRVHANPMEPRSIIALYEQERDHLTIWGGTQSAFFLRGMLAERVFRIGEDKIDIIPGDLGGSFGLKDTVPVEMALMPWAARRLGRPVKWTATRSEMIVSDNHGRDMIANAELAYDDDGTILAVRSENLNNIGAFVECWGIAPAISNVGGTVGVYRIAAAHVRVTGVLTHTSPTCPYRGAGRPEAAYIIERMIDLAADDLGLDPVEMRRRNLIPPEAMPYKTPLTFTYDCGEFEEVLDKAVAAADYAGFSERRKESLERGLLRGIGVSMSIESSATPGTETVELQFDRDGNALVLSGSTNHGQGHETVFVQYVSGLLGIEPSKVAVIEGDTRVVRTGVGTGGSRSAAYNATAITKVIEQCVAAGVATAARLLQANPADLVFGEGQYQVAQTERRVSFAEVARASFADIDTGIREAATVSIGAIAFPNACQVSEVEIDPETGSVEVVAHTICDDVGYELNPLLVKGQLMGGIMQGAGQALMEDMVIDLEGQPLTGSFMDYAMPRATDFSRFRLLSHPVPTLSNPVGVKGVGESGTSGALPAVMNAINNALGSVRAGPIDMPALPARVWRALQTARAA
ncbi:MAG: xanthine dehydrogenase family protein [Mesorhizobium sp.]|nr:MAG: xanthine dehydrogenase family protein [Mesorhizobium sp.]